MFPISDFGRGKLTEGGLNLGLKLNLIQIMSGKVWSKTIP